MGKIIIEQYIFCNTFEESKGISKAFDKFHFKFYDLGMNSSIYAKRDIRKNQNSEHYPYKVIIRYPIEFDGEFLEYGFLDKHSQFKYPELIQKLSLSDKYKKRDILNEYDCLDDDNYRDIYYYNDFEEFFDCKLKFCMNQIYMACLIAFANKYGVSNFRICYSEKNKSYERCYFAKHAYDNVCPQEYFENADISPICLSTVWEWMNKSHKYKKDRFESEARSLTALSYAINCSNFEKTFYAVIGLESVFTKSEKNVRTQLKNAITKVFPMVQKDEIDLFYTKRSDFAHGDIMFPDYYENHMFSHHWSDLTYSAQKSTALLIMSLRELVKNNAIKIIVNEEDELVFEKHYTPY